MKRNRVSAVCSCGKFIHARDHGELVERIQKHHRNCPTYKPEAEAEATP